MLVYWKNQCQPEGAVKVNTVSAGESEAPGVSGFPAVSSGSSQDAQDVVGGEGAVLPPEISQAIGPDLPVPSPSIALCAWCREAFEVFPWAGDPGLEPAEQEQFCTRGCALQAAGYVF